MADLTDLDREDAIQRCIEYLAAASPAHMGDVLGALRYIRDAHPGEPLFVIRGRDALAMSALVNGYIAECHRAGLSGQWNRAWEHAGRFNDWQRDNAKLTHLPDPLPPENTAPIPGTEKQYRVGRDM